MRRSGVAGRRNYRRSIALLRKMETPGWLKHIRHQESTFLVRCVTQQQFVEASVQKLLQPIALGSVSDLLVCHSDDSISPSELQTLHEMIHRSREGGSNSH